MIKELSAGLFLKENSQRRQAVWVAHTKYFRFRDLPPGTADLHGVDEGWPVAFKR